MDQKRRSLNKAFIAAPLLASLPLSGALAQQAAWPNGNVKLIVPFGAGGSVDRFSRGLASHWEKTLGGPAIVVENRGGAGGMLGARTFIGAPKDGSVLFAGIQPTLSMNIVAQDADFTLDDFVFVNVEQRDFSSITVRADSKYKTIEDLVNDARANPGKVKISMIPGSGTYLFGLAFVKGLNLDVNIVTFNGGGEQRTDLLGGHSDAMVASAYGDMVLGDKVRVLAVSSLETFPGWPNAVPITKAYPELKIPAIGDNRFIAVSREFAESNPKAFEALVESYKNAFNSPEYQDYITKQGSILISAYRGPEQSKQIAQELHDVVVEFKDTLKGN
ncbi:MAG: tripartite tricarboxylate transporter substrate binding protein [Burkholderiaceae bacterium]|nr:tripartite tricarboxylate transporter substrate binding protein [Burkholderiaceae bacterium]MCD8517048.1 tripartite tricarboxylate transporter substrate binding protein [Burkholderiaceae bacterium]MCD8536905.1 tripartite tricarboxylate transporter substrate binding protein [Burkholderiaceae bacterium]MCD8566069.1 tripartite tricarboxylate transporter substrate binding protein [Burkholderiaceae bacterium]